MIPAGTRIVPGRTRVLVRGRAGVVVDVVNAHRVERTGRSRYDVPAMLVVRLDDRDPITRQRILPLTDPELELEAGEAAEGQQAA